MTSGQKEIKLEILNMVDKEDFSKTFELWSEECEEMKHGEIRGWLLR